MLRTLESIPDSGPISGVVPDGKRLAFESDRGSDEGRYAVFVIGQDGRGLIQITEYSLDATHPAWSEDGRHMVFDAEDQELKVCGVEIIDSPVVE